MADQQIHPPAWRSWSADEIALLREAWERGGRLAAAAALPGRSLEALQGAAQRLKLRSPRNWPQGELDTLRRVYPDGGPAAACAALPGRSYHAVSCKAQQLGLIFMPFWWTDEERARVNEAFARGGLPAARAAAPNRTDCSLKQMVAARSPRCWTVAERRVLCTAWVKGGIDAACAALPQRTRTAIMGQARRLKLRGPDSWLRWDAVDEQMLKRLFPRLGFTETTRRMTWRTPKAIAAKARLMGLVRRRPRRGSAGAGEALAAA